MITDRTFLSQVSEEVRLEEADSIYQKLLDEVKLYPNAVGLAAVQIGILKRMFITRPDIEHEVWDSWLNPKIEIFSRETIQFYEGCLSFPDVKVLTQRPVQITVTRQRLDGSEDKFAIYGEEAVIFQHEFDHLDGKLMFDRLYVALPKIGRNELCSCNSGKKFKKCCGK